MILGFCPDQLDDWSCYHWEVEEWEEKQILGEHWEFDFGRKTFGMHSR